MKRPAFVFIVLLVLCTTARSRAQERQTFALRAEYLHNFAKFAEWPAEAFAAPGAPITICVLGTDPFGSALDRALEGASVGGRALRASRLQSPAAARGCHVLYTAATDRRRVRSALRAVRSHPVLTVGEHAGFLAAGGMIRFKQIDQRLRFDINLAAAERARLRLSARLLSVAADVKRDRP